MKWQVTKMDPWWDAPAHWYAFCDDDRGEWFYDWQDAINYAHREAVKDRLYANFLAL